MSITGGCLCRAVRYEIEAEPLGARICWCRLCQYLGAGSGTVNVGFPTDKIRVSGSLKDFQSTAASGNAMHRTFCPACGTPLFSAAESRPHVLFVRAGTLDDPEVARPQASIWTSMAPSWAMIDDSLPCIEAQPPPIA